MFEDNWPGKGEDDVSQWMNNLPQLLNVLRDLICYANHDLQKKH
jgi:hypothetical protein